MEPRFTRGEYWLLETGVRREFEVCALIESDLESFLGKKGHGLTRASLIETLHRLLSSGLIYAKSEVKGFISTVKHIELALEERVPWNTHHVFISPDGDIEIAPDESKPPRTEPVDVRKITCYGLTQEGGVQWEAFAAPDWQKYIDVSSQFLDVDSEDKRWKVVCADEDWLEMYLDTLCFYEQLEVSSESIEWDYIEPWQATYWKQLEGGHRVRFQARDKSEDENSEPSPPPFGYFEQTWCAWR